MTNWPGYCVLCNTCRESLVRRNSASRNAQDWNCKSNLAINETKTFMAKMRRVTLASAVYQIWRGRNVRIFQKAIHNWRQIVNNTEEDIRDITCKWRICRIFENQIICKEWFLSDVVMLGSYVPSRTVYWGLC